MADYTASDIYVREYLAKDSTRNEQVESARRQLAIFKKHNISKEQFYKSLEYYTANPNEFLPILKNVKKEAILQDSASRKRTLENLEIQ